MVTDLIIAGRRIRLQSEKGIALRPDERFSAFMAASEAGPDLIKKAEAGGAGVADAGPDVAYVPDLTVDLFPGRAEIPPDAVKVFDARLMEETPDGLCDTGEPFWEILAGAGVTFAKIYLKNPVGNPVLVMPNVQTDAAANPVPGMPDGKMTWQIFADSAIASETLAEGKITGQLFSDSEMIGQIIAGTGMTSRNRSGSEAAGINPLPYPLDGLLLYFLSSTMGDIMIHGSGVICSGRGWIFTGKSGSGKTTMAGIFDRAGDRVIHDDRLILRRDGGGWVMHSTPVYRNDEPRSAAVSHLWGITHGRSNVSTPVTGAEAVAMILANCVQQNRDREAASRLAASVEELVSSVRVSRLSFVPDSLIRDYLIARESDGAVTAAEAAAALLAENRPVTITAGGYSMWPAIRPGDRIVITPYNPQIPLAKEMVVALRRDGGFVVHRVTDYRRGKFMNFIRTRGDTSLIHDSWISTSDVAGLVKRVTEDNKTELISPRRTPRWLNRTWSWLDAVIRPRIKEIGGRT